MKTEEFIQLCREKKWEVANAYVDECWEQGREIEAERLRRVYLKFQAEEEEVFTFEPFTHEEPPVLEAGWFEGSPKEYKEADEARANETEERYRELTQKV